MVLRGVLTFRAGEPHNATTDDGLSGQEAALRLMELEHGTYLLKTDESRVVGSRKILRSFSELALDEFFTATESSPSSSPKTQN